MRGEHSKKIMTRAAAPIAEGADVDVVTRAAAISSGSMDKENRSIDAIFATDAPTLVMDRRTWNPIDEVLRMDGMIPTGKIPVLKDHNHYSTDAVMGSATGMKRTDHGMSARLSFVKGDPEIDRTWNKIEQGHLDSVSAGYRVFEYTDIPAGTSRMVKGVSYKAGPDRTLRISTQWQPKEISIVPIGADEFSKMRSAANLPRPIRKDMSMNRTLLAYLLTLGLRAEAPEAEALEFHGKLEDAQRDFADSLAVRSKDPDPDPTPEPEPDPAPAPTEESRRAAIEQGRLAELNRRAAITKLAGKSIPAELLARALDEDKSVEQAKDLFLDHYRNSKEPPVKTAPGIIVRMGESDLTPELLSGAILHRAGRGEDIVPAKVFTKSNRVVPEARRKMLDEIQGRSAEFSYMPLIEVCRMAIEMDGQRPPHNPIEIAKRALSGGTLASIFTQSIDATMLQAYEVTSDSTAPLTRVRDVANFKTQTEFAMQNTSAMALLPRGGSIRDTSIDDNQETFKVHRYGEHFTVDEQDIVDDRFNALSDVPREMAVDAAQVFPDLFFALLVANPTMATDSVAMFDSTAHGNVIDTAYSRDQLKAAHVAMMKQRLNGKNLNITPQFILAGPDLMYAILQDLESAAIVLARGGTTDLTVERGTANTVQGLVKPIFDARIANGVTDPLTGTAYAGSTTAWYVFGSPDRTRGIVRAFLAGSGRAPSLTNYVKNGQGGKFGIEFTIKLDVGIGVGGYRGQLRGNV